MTRDELLSSMSLVSTTNSVYFGDDRYADWGGTRTSAGEYGFEVSDGTDSVVLYLTREQLQQLHTQLTLTLLRDVEV